MFLKENIDNLKEYTISAIYIDGAHILDLIKIDVHLALSCIENNELPRGKPRGIWSATRQFALQAAGYQTQKAKMKNESD